MNPARKRTRLLHLLVGGGVLLAAVTAAAAHAADPGEAGGAPWASHIRAMDAALARGDVGAALGARHEAYLAALGSRRWEAMAAVGEASVRFGELAGAPRAMVPEARRVYLLALFRARQQRSLDGVLQAAEAFARLGDRDAARQSLVIAAGLAAASPEPHARERVRALRRQLAEAGPAMTGAARVGAPEVVVPSAGAPQGAARGDR